MKIGVIGSGNMGRAIGVRLAMTGNAVFFGARHEQDANDAAALATHGSHSGTISDAVRFGDILLWTMRETDPSKVLADTSLLAGKILIDLNNRDYATEVKQGAWFERSIAEQLQENAPKSQVVKAFNTIGMESFDIPTEELRAAGAQTFVAGRDADAKQQVAALAEQLGFKVIDLGSDVAAFRAAEALGDVIRMLMIDGGHGGQAHFRLITLPAPTLQAVGKRGDSSYA